MNYVVHLKHGISSFNYFFYTVDLKFKLTTYYVSDLGVRVMVKCAARSGSLPCILSR